LKNFPQRIFIIIALASLKLHDAFRNYTDKCGLFEDKLVASSEANVNVATEWVAIAADDSGTNSHCRFGYRGSTASPFTFVLHVGNAEANKTSYH